jgi:hypothetical protein
MKQISLFFLLVFCAITLHAQVIISQNFDALTAGTYAAQQLGAPWTTWSGTTGNTEDPSVSTTQSSSAPNAVYVSTTSNDFVCHLSDKTTGRYKISFSYFVESGKMGYFNILNDFAGSNSIWAMQAYFRSNGYCIVDAGGASVDSVAYTSNTWNNIVFIIDVDDDFATMYFNGTELVSWVFSSGSFGDGTTHKLDAVNFYGLGEDLQPGYYIDNFVFEQVPVPDAPMNLTAATSGYNVDLSWTAPSGSPTSYTVMRNNNIIADGLTTLNHTDNNLYPTTYTFTAKAHYAGLGYSHSSNDTTVTIAGGIGRNCVLFEVTTAVLCPYCPGAAMGMEDLTSNGKSVAIVEYHNDWQGADPFANTASQDRSETYATAGMATGNPTAIADGTIFLSGGSGTLSLYSTYLPWYNTRIARHSIHDIDLSIVKTGTDTYEATVVVEETNGYYPGNLKLRTALTESNIAYNWQNQTELHWVCRDMFPNASGTALDFSSTSTQTYTTTFSTAGYVADNCEFVAWVQLGATGDVIQASKVDLSTVIGIEEANAASWSVYPNPANDQITIAGIENAQYEIVNIQGQVVLSGTIENNTEIINTSNLNQGSYFIRIVGEDVMVKTFVIE